jgi:hypothetical protein
LGWSFFGWSGWVEEPKREGRGAWGTTWASGGGGGGGRSGGGTVEVCDGVVRSPSARLRLLSTFEWILVSARYREGGMSCDHVNDQDLNLFVLRRKKRSDSALDQAVVADG